MSRSFSLGVSHFAHEAMLAVKHVVLSFQQAGNSATVSSSKLLSERVRSWFAAAVSLKLARDLPFTCEYIENIVSISTLECAIEKQAFANCAN